MTTFVWDAGDRLVSQTDPAGGVTSFTYDANDHPLTRTDPDGAVTTYEWDALFRVVKITAPDGGQTSFEYNTEDELVGTTDPLGNELTVTLDDLYRAVTITDPTGGEWDRAYDPAGNLLTETDPAGAVTGYAYDPVGRMTEVTDAEGGVSTTVYDEVGRVVSDVDALGGTVLYEYDLLDRLVEVTDQAGETEQYGYDPLGNLTEHVDRRGHETTYAYDAASQLVSWAGPEGTGGSYTYDPRGNQVTATDALARTVTTGYDALSRPVSSTDPLGNVSTVGYDAMGRVVADTDANGHAYQYDYDLAGRLIASVDPLGATTSYAYDTAGRRTSMTDPNGNVTRYQFDALSRLTAVTEGYVAAPAPTGTDVNVTTSYAYTATGDLASVTDPTGAVTAYTYDHLGRTLTETNPLGKVWQYQYDDLGRTTRKQDANGKVTTYAYTARSDLAAIDYPGSLDVTFEYDADQNMIGMTDGLGGSGWVFDDAGRVTRQTDSLGNVLDYAYDATGARTTLGLPEGDVGYQYDAAGRPIRQTTPWGSLAYGWDPAGNLTDVLRSNGVTTDYAYDAADQVTDITHTSPGAEIGCDLNGNDIEVGVDIDTLIDLNLCLTVDIDVPVLTGLDYGDQIALSYSYDAAGNVATQTRKDGSSPAVTTTYGYDRLSRLVTSAATDGTDNTYKYDKAGNRTKWVTNQAPDTGAALTVDAVFNAAGQVTSEKKTRPGLLGIPTVTTTTYTHDSNGNRTREQTGTAVTDYTYTPDDRLASVDQGLREVSYEYDGLGRNLQQSVSSLLVLQNRTEQLWDGMVVVAQDSTATGAASLVRDVMGDVAIQSTTGLLGAVDTRWGVTDRLGSTIGQAQGSKITQLAEYSDWGMPTFGTAGWNSRTGYTGELGDTTAGLWNFYARSYDPTTATWLHPDPYRGELTAPQTLGRYGYVGNNPATATDAYGYAAMVKIKGEPNIPRKPAKTTSTPPVPPTATIGTRANAPADASVPSQRHREQSFPSDQDIWNGLSMGFGVTAAVLNGLGTLAGVACFYGEKACAAGLLVSRAAGLVSLQFSIASTLTDCIGNNWDGKCWAGVLYTLGTAVTTVMPPPIVSNLVSGGMQVAWLFTTR